MKNIYLFILCYCFLSCSNNEGQIFVEENGHMFLLNYDENGVLRLKQSLDSDSIQNGSCFYFNEAGVLERKLEFVDGIVQGIDSGYYESGRVRYWAYLINGKYVYDSYEYYDLNEKLFYVLSDDNDTIVVSEPRIKRYMSYDLDGEVAFEVLYDKESQITNIEGESIVGIAYDEGFATINEMYNIYYHLALPPFIRSEFRYKSIGKESNSFGWEILKANNDFNRVKIEFIEGEEGQYTLMGVHDLYKKDKLVNSDTMYFVVKVMPH